MTTSEIRLYRTEITPEKNAVIDDIRDYLSTKCTLTYEEYKFQYQKIDINKTVTISTSQVRVGNQSLGNYCDIYQDKRHFYYFIMNVEWISSSAIRLTLSMDTLNTFKDDLEFSAQTTIQREHRDRFKDVYEDDFEYDATKIGGKNTIRLIDIQPEGLPTVKKAESNTIINDTKTDNLDWYLIYQTRDDLTKDNISNPISCGLCANIPLLIKKGFSNLPEQTLYPNQVTSEYYYFDPINNPGGKIRYKTETSEGTRELRDSDIIRIHVANGGFVIENLLYTNEGGYYSFKQDTVINSSAVKYITFINSSLLTISGKINGHGDIVNNKRIKVIQTGSKENASTVSFDKIDKTDSKLMKILRLPYCPIEISKNSDGTYNIPSSWELRNGLLNLKTYNLSEEFLNNISDISLDDYLKAYINVTPKSAILAFNESKLYNSEFYTFKFVYDSFVKDIRLEDFRFNSNYDDTPLYLNVSFKPTNTVNSKFAFKFSNISENVKYVQKEDYEDFLIVNRNNEETIFSNDYINYIRNGYNYDKKARDMGLVQNLIGGALGLGQAGAAYGVQRHQAGREFNNIIGGKTDLFDTYNADRKAFIKNTTSPFLSAAAISAGFGAVNSLVNAGYSYQQANDNIARKQQELSQQATNVQGADDVDLLKYYNNNRLELKTYDLEDANKQIINKVFHYTGYSHPFQEIPNMHSRYWFNYVQCTPIFKNENTEVYTNYLDDIKARFEKGVTYFHHHPEIDIGWDLYQQYENWESKMLDTTYLPSDKLTLGLNNVTFVSDRIPQIKWDINIPIDSTYQSIEVKYKIGSREVFRSAIGNSIALAGYRDGDIYIRRKYTLNEPLSSDWELVRR